MATYRIEFEKAALKFLKRQDKKTAARIFSAVRRLPEGTNIRKMEGYDLRYRLRIGNIRVIYDKYDDVLVIVIVEIGYRGDVYK